ncbi:MAG TPA: tRNA (adenosine(37)-N6)-threonylcarbamoyltransferase complex transferase subunit TsaD [Bacteroidales bacterium]|nr:tRNA (adenosine(37)-N6)-threonylcarbamoyltransferase complex transferase subunit TsaD [Bacteroidales bacterium]
MPGKAIYVLGIESSCDDTSAAVIRNDELLSNIIANQDVHKKYGGVVPELASRSHQQNIIPVIQAALDTANVNKNELQAVSFTRGPGLLGSLLVGSSFAKALSLGLSVPLIEVDHLEAHILAHFIQEPGASKAVPAFPFLCLTVSGGHTQIVLIRDYFDMEIIGRTMDDAAGEAFDKAAKIMGLPYPGGPWIDQHSKGGNPTAYCFSKPRIPGLDFSFSGLKTSFLYFLRDRLKEDPEFISKNMADLCASIQQSIVDILLNKLIQASEKTGISTIAIAGGVAANSALRDAVRNQENIRKWQVFVPKIAFTTDNAAMVAICGYYKYLRNQVAGYEISPYSRSSKSRADDQDSAP